MQVPERLESMISHNGHILEYIIMQALLARALMTIEYFVKLLYRYQLRRFGSPILLLDTFGHSNRESTRHCNGCWCYATTIASPGLLAAQASF